MTFKNKLRNKYNLGKTLKISFCSYFVTLLMFILSFRPPLFGLRGPRPCKMAKISGHKWNNKSFKEFVVAIVTHCLNFPSRRSSQRDPVELWMNCFQLFFQSVPPWLKFYIWNRPIFYLTERSPVLQQWYNSANALKGCLFCSFAGFFLLAGNVPPFCAPKNSLKVKGKLKKKKKKFNIVYAFKVVKKKRVFTLFYSLFYG